jgi:imidazolonepropionase-like amidohydrolase
VSTGYIHIRNARLIDGSGNPPPAAPHALLVEGERIVAVAPQAELPPPPGAQQIDAHGMTLMPGLIDCHDHLANLPGGMVARAAIPPTLAVFLAAESFRQTLLAGITAVRDASGVDLGMKMAVEQGLIPGPRLKISVNIICQFGGHNDHTEPAGIDSTYPKLQTIPDGVCDGVDACRHKVREMVRAGADWIKIATTGGVGTPTGGPLLRQFSLEEVRAIVDTAHAAGKPVMSHAYGGDGVKVCLDAGVDSIEHGAALDDALIEQMVRQNTWLVPTFTVLRKIAALGDIEPCPVPAYMPRKARSLMAAQAESFPQGIGGRHSHRHGHRPGQLRARRERGRVGVHGRGRHDANAGHRRRDAAGRRVHGSRRQRRRAACGNAGRPAAGRRRPTARCGDLAVMRRGCGSSCKGA